jgi:hypothetical protein
LGKHRVATPWTVLVWAQQSVVMLPDKNYGAPRENGVQAAL